MPIFRTAKRGVQYSEALAEAYASAPEDEVILQTLEFRHSTFMENGNPFAIRVVNDHSVLTATLEATAPMDAGTAVDFSPVYFRITRPPESESGATGEVAISVDNVAKHLIPYLDQAKGSREPIYVTWRPFLLSDLTGPHMNPPLTLTMRTITCSMTMVTGRAGFRDFANKRYPAREYTATNHPSLVVR